MTDRPVAVKEKHLAYLDSLRESGTINMFGAGSWLQNAFNLPRRDAQTVLTYWMKTFDERHLEEES